MAAKKNKPESTMTSVACFQVHGDFITEHARNLWREGSFKRAFDVLDCMMNDDNSAMRRDLQIDIIEGKRKLEGINNVDLLDDDWVPPDDYPSFLTLVERAASFDAEELEKRRRHDAEQFLKEAARLSYPGRWSDSSIITEVDDLKRQAAVYIGATAVDQRMEELYEEMIPGEDFDEDEDIGKQGVSRSLMALTGIKPGPLETADREERGSDRVDPMTMMYAMAQQKLMMAALESGQGIESVPSVGAMMNRGYDIVPKLYPDMSSPSGWLLPDGKYYGCGNMEHIGLADVLLAPEVGGDKNCEGIAEERGWIKISVGALGCNVIAKKKPTKKQRDKVFDYAEKHGRDYKKLMQSIELCFHEDD